VSKWWRLIYMTVIYGVGVYLLCITAGWRAAVGVFMLVWGHQIEKHGSNTSEGA